MYFNVHRGSSGILANLSDCAQFMEGLIDGRLLGPDALAIMTAPSFPGYEWRGLGIGGYDWFDNQGKVHRLYEMAGSGVEGMVYTRYFPLEGVTISIATNIGSTNRDIAHDLFNGLLDDLTSAVFNLRQGRDPSRGIKSREKIRDRPAIR